MKNPKLRIARATNQLPKISQMYTAGLGLEVVAGFTAHEGYDGVMIGSSSLDYHFEFTAEEGYVAPRSHCEENLIVFYIPEKSNWDERVRAMFEAGFKVVPAKNPYWDRCGKTFEDVEGYRIVIAHQEWKL